MNNEITDTHKTAESGWNPDTEPGEVAAEISATHNPTGDRFEFNVQMRGFTMREMDDLIVEAAARLIVGNQGDNAVAKAIETKCIELIDQKASAALAKITAEIIDAPLIPSFSDKKPVTMRELIGLYGVEYLTTKVGRDGKPTRESGWGNSQPTRIEWLVSQCMNSKFQQEIEKATRVMITEIQTGIMARHNAMLAAEKGKIAAALKNLAAAP